MINYIPFLKLKSNEIIGTSYINDGLLSSASIFFEFAKDDKITAENFQEKVTKTSKKVAKYLFRAKEIYLDNQEVLDSIKVNGVDNYKYILDTFLFRRIIPVASIDRTIDHNKIACDFARKSSRALAIRVGQEFFRDYDEFGDDFEAIFEMLDDSDVNIDIIYDCRIISMDEVDSIASKIKKFHLKIKEARKFRRIIAAGSSIHPSTSDNVAVGSESFVDRAEIALFKKLLGRIKSAPNLFLGDYATVTPDLLEIKIPDYAIYSRTTAKLTYTFDHSHYFVRGKGIKSDGLDQYFDLAGKIVKQGFFRGRAYSYGEQFLVSKSKKTPPACTPGTVIGPSICSHITYMLSDFDPSI